MSGTVGGMEAAGERAGGAAGSGSTSGSLSPAPAGGDEEEGACTTGGRGAVVNCLWRSSAYAAAATAA
jgi:hypothetical protein